MGLNPIRLTVVATHPVQYQAPWFRYIATNCPDLDLTVLYAARPTPMQQGVGFDHALQWDRPLEEGYRARVVREEMPGAVFDSESFRGLDVKEIGAALIETRPDVVMIPGWHSITLTRALVACRRRGIPVLYRGDTTLDPRSTGLRRLIRRLRTRGLVRMFSAALAVGKRSRAYLLHHGVPPTSIHSAPHAVDNEFFASAAEPHLTPDGRQAARAAFGASSDDFVVLFVGKLMDLKRPLDLVHAAARLGQETVLLVAGAGELEPRIRAEAGRLSVRLAFLGFVNQTDLPRCYAAADCLAVPSARESWGLVVNEAMATGLPAVVSDTVGCGDDLVTPGETGDVFHAGDVEGLASALGRVRERGGRRTMAEGCRRRIASFGFERASTGLVAACEALVPRRQAPRVVVCGAGMVIAGGLERMTFEVLRVVRQHGGSVHCIVNSWENHRIVALAEDIGASWSTGFHWYALRRRAQSPLHALRMVWDIGRTSLGLLGDAIRCRATHVLVPEHGAVLRNAPALALLRITGVKIIFRMGNAPERGRFYDILWRRAVSPFVTCFVPNSQFGRSRLQETGVATTKITLIRNVPSRRVLVRATDEDVVVLAAGKRTILTVGQIAPFKGTHLAVDAVLRLVDEGHDVQAVIVGALPTWPGDLAAYGRELQERARRAGADDRVHFVGSRENVPAIMKASYVLAAPILQEETFGNVLLEARHAGLPVVTFDRGGLTELVSHGETGFVCRSADLHGLVEGLEHFLTQPAERDRASRNSLAAGARPGEECTPAEFERRWWAIFERAS